MNSSSNTTTTLISATQNNTLKQIPEVKKNVKHSKRKVMRKSHE
jgi:hypothetical protein